MSFDSLGLADVLLRAVHDKGYTTPSPIQAQAIPAILAGKDVMAAAQTGTGKTAGFTLPLLQRLSQGKRAGHNRVRALVLTPTRELAAQVAASVQEYGRHVSLSATVVYGGVKINPQMQALRRGADVLVATPGRLMDLYQQNAISFNDLEIVVLDEADRMLDMGFIRDIKKILALLPKSRQNLLFSATFSPDIRQLARGLMNNPVEIDVSPRNAAAESVEQCIHPVDKARKPQLLSHLIRSNDWRQVLVFSRTKHGANKLVTLLGRDGIRAAAIHGNKSQAARMKALDDFKRGRVTTLVATDIAARGIDIVELPQVVNFDLPHVPEDYVHRIGRTGRAGLEGKAVSLVSADEAKQLADIERLIKRKLTRDEISGFEPDHSVPDIALRRSPPKPNRPKRNDSRPSGNNPRRRNSERSNENSGKTAPWVQRAEGAAEPKPRTRRPRPRKPASSAGVARS